MSTANAEADYLDHLRETYGDSIDDYLERMRQGYEAGNPECLFYAVNMCLRTNYLAPQWARDAFRDGWGRYTGAIPGLKDKPGQSTLGGAFGIVRPNNFKPYAARRRKYASLIWQFVEKEKKAGAPVDEYLFERAAELVPSDGDVRFTKIVYDVDLPDSERKGIKATTAKNMYYEYVDMIRRSMERAK